MNRSKTNAKTNKNTPDFFRAFFVVAEAAEALRPWHTTSSFQELCPAHTRPTALSMYSP